jgi:hypothetical protein
MHGHMNIKFENLLRKQYNGALSFQFIENQGPVHVLNITCSSSGGSTQMAFGILAVARFQFHCDRVTANGHYTHIVNQMLFVQQLLRMSM